MDRVWTIITVALLVTLLFIVTDIGHDVTSIQNQLDTPTTTVPSTTSTTYMGVKCMVKGYEINTSLKNARVACR